MSAHRNDVSTSDRINITAKIIAFPSVNRSEVARQAGISRPTVYAVARKGRQALAAVFEPRTAPPPVSDEGFWLWLDVNAQRASDRCPACDHRRHSLHDRRHSLRGVRLAYIRGNRS